MQTITIEILDDTALAILNDLALQQMIKVQQINPTVYQAAQMKSLKGAMKKQLIADVDNQLNELRNDWKWIICGTPILQFIFCRISSPEMQRNK